MTYREDRTLEVRGVPVTLTEAGDPTTRPALVLHGGAGPGSVAPLAAHLAANHYVLAPTHPGWDLPPATRVAPLRSTSASSRSADERCLRCRGGGRVLVLVKSYQRLTLIGGVKPDETTLTTAIIDLAKRYGRYGYHRITALLRHQG